MNVVHKLVLDCGEYDAPQSLVDAMATMPMKTVVEEYCGESYKNSYPDPATKEGKRYWKWVREQNDACAKAWMSGKEFKPADFQ